MFFGNNSSENEFEYIIHNFEGPLNLLLSMINDAKIEIKDIFVSEITTQFLERVKQMEALEMEVATEFLVVAATLLEIKSNSVLPPVDGELVEIEESPKERIISLLTEYKAMKEAGKELKRNENINRYYRARDERINDTRIALRDFTIDNLMDAFTKVFLRFEKNKIQEVKKEIIKDPFTVEEKVEMLKELLNEKVSFSFFEIFKQDNNRYELITTFQALLEILKEQIATCEQLHSYGDIIITLRKTS